MAWQSPDAPLAGAPPFCSGCGRPAAACPDGCAARLAHEPPRHCTTCGFRLDVQVFPDHVESSCRECRRRVGGAEHSRTT